MITAQEAKTLYDQSGAEIDEFLQKHEVEKGIKEAASTGKRAVFIHCGFENLLYSVEPTPLYKSVMNRLSTLGYTVVWYPRYGMPFVPRGLDDGHGDGPMHQNYGIEIRW